MTLSLHRVVSVAALVLATTAGVASAESPSRGWGWGGWGSTQTPGVDRRQAVQAHQIERGRANGSLTASEYQALKVEQARIAELERRAKADGRVTPLERAQLRAAQEGAARHIYNETHDRDVAGRGRGWGFGR